MPITDDNPIFRKVPTMFNYVSSLDQLKPVAEGAHKPDVLTDVVPRYGRPLMTGFMEAMGAKSVINAMEQDHYEDEWIHGTFRIDAPEAGGGNTLTATIATDYSYTFDGNNSPYASTDTFVAQMPQVYDEVRVNGWAGVVISVTGADIVVESVDTNVPLPAIAITDDFIIANNHVPEGSTSTESRNGTLKKFTSYLQTSRRDHVLTATETGNETWMEFEYEGRKAYYWYLKGLQDENHRIINEREVALLTNKRFNNAALTSGGSASFGDLNTAQSTEGLIPKVDLYGHVNTYTTGSFGYTDLSSMASKLQKYRGAKENNLFTGFSFGEEFDEIARDTANNVDNGGIVWAKFNDMPEQGLDFQIDYYSLLGFRFNKTVLDIFTHPKMLGAEGQGYDNFAVLVPADNIAIYNEQNRQSQEMIPSLNLLTRKDTNGERWFKEWVTGTQLGAMNSDFDGASVHMLTEYGLRVPALNRYGIFRGL